MRCCVPFCKTTAEVVSESEEITFHEFPREVHLRAAWLSALGKQDTPLPEPAVVCSQHFLSDDIYETESGSRQIRTGAVPSTVLVCMICLDTRSKLFLMSKYKLDEAYEHLVGQPLCGQGKLRQTLCVQCAQRLVNFSTFRDKSLRTRSLMMELLDRHEVVTIRHVKLISRVKHQLQSDIVSAVSEPDYCDLYIAHSDADGRTDLHATGEAVAVKREIEDCEDDEDESAAAEAATETQAPAAHIKVESSGDCDQALVLATNHADEEHPPDTDDEVDILSLENNTNIFEYSRKSQDSALKPMESAKISDYINFRTTRRNDLSKNNCHFQDILGTPVGDYTDQIQYICDICQKIFRRKSSLGTHIRAHTFSCKLGERKSSQTCTSSSPRRTHTGEKPFACKLCKYKCARSSHLVRHMRTHTEMRCCVPFCKTTAEVVSESEEITFHEFPREVHLRAAWLSALGKQDTPLPEPAVVCSQHFLSDDIYETESGSRQIRTGAVPSTVLVCMICLDTRSKLFLMSKYKLDEAYEHLVGHPLCGQGKLRHTLCVQCAQRLVTIRHVKLISRVKHQLQSDIVSAVSEPDYCDLYIAHSDADGRTDLHATGEAVAVKREVEDCEDDEDEPAAAEAATETQAPAAYVPCVTS
ncbi:uncharacterized protein LOC123877933 [Maniola jurtina]|uniref:uncharacterized protein LOC123877933 n=1 Tax=Maniola jurtina TaxID=191418 RepID=UPI001E68A0A3|nr:uncharacterized protein LOC123877933 [Maniola jurtina]